MTERRIIIKKVCFTESEAKRVEADAKRNGMSVSEYMRNLTKNKPKEHPEVIKLFKQLINEINHIGTNINQIARNCNSGIYTYEDKKKMFAYLKVINMKLREVIDKYGNK